MAVAIMAGGIATMGAASAKTTPKLLVKPATGLKNHEMVVISGTGFKPGDTVFLVECLRTAKGQAGCRTPAPFPPSVTITAKGILRATHFKVVTGKVGNGTCGTKKTNLNKCDLSAGNAVGGDSATYPIVFK
jgi:hypothetical protein